MRAFTNQKSVDEATNWANNIIARNKDQRNEISKSLYDLREFKVKTSYIEWGVEKDEDLMHALKLAQTVKRAVVELKKYIATLDLHKGVIDHQFQLTFWVSLKQLIVYLIFHVYPLLRVIYGTQDKQEDKESYLRRCLVIQSIFMANEILQFCYLGVDYLKNYWNYFQVLQFGCMIAYYSTVDLSKDLIPFSTEGDTKNLPASTLLLQVALLLLCMIQALFMIRIFKKFG